jgi:hypothetical protein
MVCGFREQDTFLFHVYMYTCGPFHQWNAWSTEMVSHH